MSIVIPWGRPGVGEGERAGGLAGGQPRSSTAAWPIEAVDRRPARNTGAAKS